MQQACPINAHSDAKAHPIKLWEITGGLHNGQTTDWSGFVVI